jgi:hypothetical protein
VIRLDQDVDDHDTNEVSSKVESERHSLCIYQYYRNGALTDLSHFSNHPMDIRTVLPDRESLSIRISASS